MKMLIQIVLVALIVGGLSAGGSFYWHLKLAKSATVAPEHEAESTEKSDDKEKPDSDSEEAKTVADESHADAEHAEQVDATDAAHTNEVAALTTEPKAAPLDVNHEPPPFGPPAGVRPPFDPHGDEGGEMINRLRATAAMATRQDRRLEEREEAMKLIIGDLRSEQAKAAKTRKQILDELNRSVKDVEDARRLAEAERAAIYRAAQAERTKMQQSHDDERRLASEELQKLVRQKDDAIQAVEDALKIAREEQDELRRQKEEMQKSLEPKDNSGSPEESANLKDTVRRIDSMPAENTAKILQELVLKGRKEAVIAILNGMKPRQCASVMSLIAESEPALAADLIDGMKRLKKDTQAPPAQPAK